MILDSCHLTRTVVSVGSRIDSPLVSIGLVVGGWSSILKEAPCLTIVMTLILGGSLKGRHLDFSSMLLNPAVHDHVWTCNAKWLVSPAGEWLEGRAVVTSDASLSSLLLFLLMHRSCVLLKLSPIFVEEELLQVLRLANIKLE